MALALAPAAIAGAPAGSVQSTRLLQETLAHRSVRGDVGAVQQILEVVPDQLCAALDQDGLSSLHHAVRNGHLVLVRDLLAGRADPNVRDSRGQTPLHFACEEGHEDQVLELLVRGAAPDAADSAGQTPLHRAVRGTKTEVPIVLLDNGRADASLADVAGTTPLMLAAEHGKADMVELLVSRTPELVHAANQHGWTALHLAAHGREMRKRTLQECRQGKFATAVRRMLEAKAEADVVDEDKKTPLHRAATTGNHETALALIEAGATVNFEDNCRWTPLHYACQEGHLECARLLLERRAALESQSCISPLTVATMEVQVRIAELLLKHRADPHFRCKGSASPMMIARKDKEKCNEILALFELGWIAHS